MDSSATYCRPGLLRHLVIMLYDSLLLLSVLMLAGLIAVVFNGGHAINQGDPFFLAYLFGVCFLFYGWFWTHGGQTLGMQSWKVQLITDDNADISWQRAFIRFAAAIIAWLPAGLGFWWQYLAKNNRSWPDSWSGTRLHYSKQGKTKP